MGGGNVGEETGIASSSSGSGSQSTPQSLVYVDAAPLHKYFLKKVTTSVAVLVDVKANRRPKQEEAPRVPFELAIVLDKSGSMEGDKLEKSKIAIKNILNNLSSDDIVHFITYDSSVSTVFTDGNQSRKEELEKMVDGIEAGSCTNLFGGLVGGIHSLKKSTQNDDNKRSKRIFLFSDGLVNEGVTDKDTIISKCEEVYRELGITVSTFGVGSDFDESLMKPMAERGGGFYFYIRDAGEIGFQVGHALHGLLSVIGTDPLIKFSGMNGCEIERIHAHQSEEIEKGVKLKDIKEGDWKRLIVFLSVRSQGDLTTSEDVEREIFAYNLSYTDIDRKPQTIEGTIRVIFTDDESKVIAETNTNKKVEAAIVVTETAAIDAKVESLLEEGKREEAVAVKQEAVKRLKKVYHADKIAAAMCNKAESTLNVIEKGDIRQAKKEAQYDQYLEADEEDVGFGLLL